jgi:hypothetical protein
MTDTSRRGQKRSPREVSSLVPLLLAPDSGAMVSVGTSAVPGRFTPPRVEGFALRWVESGHDLDNPTRPR